MNLNPLKIFIYLWSFAHTFHYQWDYLEPSIRLFSALAVSTLALLLLIFPKVHLLICLALAQIIDYLIILPAVPNHWTLTTIINFLIILNYFAKPKEFNFEHFKNIACLSVLIFYFFTFFWKLNTGFLNPESSCAMIFAKHIGFYLFGVELNPPSLTPIITLCIEALIPILLLIKSTRIYGVSLALVFHCILVLDYQKFFVNFSAVMTALLFLFLNIKNLFIPKFIKLSFQPSILALLITLIIAISIQTQEIIWMPFRYFIGFLIYAIIFWLVLINIKAKNLSAFQLNFSKINKITLIVPLTVFLNGISPILGIKTGSAWQMYSNLYISEKESNHYLVPFSLDLFDELKHKVIIKKQNKALTNLLVGSEVPFLELGRLCAKHDCQNLKYEYRGKIIRSNGRTEKDYYLNNTWFKRNVFRFLPQSKEAQYCSW